MVDTAVRAVPATAPPVVPHLADGVELVGEFHGSGYKEPKYLVCRADGQHIQLPHVLYRLAVAIDGRRDTAQIAAHLTDELGRDLGAGRVAQLIEAKLVPAGIAAAGPGATAQIASPRPDPLLMLRFRLPVVPEHVVWRVAGVLAPIFAPVAVVVALLAFVAVDIALLVAGLDAIVAASVGLVQAPASALLVIVALLLAGVLHECGHVGACRYGGARPGPMGVGIYLVWPAYYSTVTDSYRLSRAGRLRTDLGGVYVNAILMALGGGAWLVTGAPWLLVAVLILHLETARQFLPSIRLDGYYILSDLIGLPDLFMYLRPVLSSLVPGREPHPRVAELKPRVRRIIVAWVLLVIPFLLSFLVLFVVLAPRVLPVVWQTLLGHLGTIGAGVRGGDGSLIALNTIQLLFLLLPVLGVCLLIGLLVRRIAGWLRETPRPRDTARERPPASLLVIAIPAVLLALLALAGHDQRPAAPTEAALAAAVAGVGSPGLAVPVVDPVAAHQIAAVDALLGGVLPGGTGALDAARAVLVVAGLATALLLWPVARRLRLPGTAAGLVVAVAAFPLLLLPWQGVVDAGGVAAFWLAAAAALSGRGRGADAGALLAVGAAVLTAPVVAVGLLAFAAHGLASRQVGSDLRRPAAYALSGIAAVAAAMVTVLTVPLGPNGPLPLLVPVLVAGAVVVGLAQYRLAPLRPVATAAGALLLAAAVPGPHSATALLVALPVLAVLAGVWTYAVTDPHRPLQGRLVLTGALLVAALGAVPGVVAAAAPDHDPHRLAAWVGDELDPDAVLAVEPLTAAQLLADGVPADRLVAPGDPRATVATAGTGPLLLELSSGPDARPLRVHATTAGPDGPDAPPGALLAGNPALDLAPDAAAVLRADGVDPRLATTLAGLAGVHDLDIAAFPAVPGEPAAASRRTAVVTAVDGVPVTDPAGAQVLTRWLDGQQPPFRPSDVTATGGGLAVHYTISRSLP